MTTKNDSEVCCPQFDPIPWENTTHQWQDKLFIKDSMPVIFHIPMPWLITKLMTRMMKKVEDSGASPETKDFIILTYDPSPWRSEYYIYVLKEVQNAENVKISGTFISKVFDGPYQNVPKFMKETESYVSGLGSKVKKFYSFYTTCPKCAKKYGHNYIVILAEV